MKLASLKAGRDGELVVVSRDLETCLPASAVVPTLQAALDQWDLFEPELRKLERDLDTDGRDFEPADCAAPISGPTAART